MFVLRFRLAAWVPSAMQGFENVALRHRMQPNSTFLCDRLPLLCLPLPYSKMSANVIRRNLWQASKSAVFTHHHAPFRIAQRQPAALRQLRSHSVLSSRHQQTRALPSVAKQCRCESTETQSYKPLTDRADVPKAKEEETIDEIEARKAQQPCYEITFTCRKCLERSSHKITKQSYHFGTTLITCPGCKNRHLISDHLKIFSDKSITLEDILREKGQFLKKGRLGEDGDIEFYDETNNEIGQQLAQQGDAQAKGKE